MQPDALIGTVLDNRYRIEHMLGEGGMGMVYLGEHVRTGRKCAVKLLPPEATGDVDAVQRFEREGRVLGALGHPGIVGIHDFSETPDGRPYFVMDYLEGEDLARRLKRVGRMDWEGVQKIVDEVAAALWAAHQAGVLHRDLKPGNVFLARSRAAPERVVLLDFGLAKGGITDALTITQSNMVMGTPLYMSPEQARSVGVDARSDIYSLAALIFELLAGRPPFLGPNYTAVLASLLTDPPPKLSALASAPVPPHLDLVLDVALSKDPAARHPDVAAFATAVLQRRPAWADTTGRTLDPVLGLTGPVGVATGPAPPGAPAPNGLALGATVASSPSAPAPAPSGLALDATVASSPPAPAPSGLALDATVASSPPAPAPGDLQTDATVLSGPALRPAPAVVPAFADPGAVPQTAVDPAPTYVVAQPPPEGGRRSLALVLVLGLVVLAAVALFAGYWIMRSPGGSGSEDGQAQAPGKSVAAAAVEARPTSTPDAGTLARAPDAAVARGQPKGLNKGIDSFTKSIANLKKDLKKTVEKKVNAATGSMSPPKVRLPPDAQNSLALLAYFSRSDYKGCLRAAQRMPVSPRVLWIAATCAANLRRYGTTIKLCGKYIRLYPTGSKVANCVRIMKSLQYQLNLKNQRRGPRD